jgi:hypothetical protein
VSKANDVEETSSDFHLVESSGGWTLTITVTDRLRAAIAEQENGQRGGEPESFSVHVEPNLLPADPFDAVLVLETTERPDTTTEESPRGSRPDRAG